MKRKRAESGYVAENARSALLLFFIFLPLRLRASLPSGRIPSRRLFLFYSPRQIRAARREDDKIKKLLSIYLFAASSPLSAPFSIFLRFFFQVLHSSSLLFPAVLLTIQNSSWFSLFLLKDFLQGTVKINRNFISFNRDSSLVAQHVANYTLDIAHKVLHRIYRPFLFKILNACRTVICMTCRYCIIIVRGNFAC